MIFNKIVGEKIKEIRLSRNISQEQLALRANIDRTYISDIERGKRSISLFVALKIALVLDTDFTNIIKKDDDTYFTKEDLDLR